MAVPRPHGADAAAGRAGDQHHTPRQAQLIRHTNPFLYGQLMPFAVVKNIILYSSAASQGG